LQVRGALDLETLNNFLAAPGKLFDAEKLIFLKVFDHINTTEHKKHFDIIDVEELIYRGMGIYCETKPDDEIYSAEEFLQSAKTDPYLNPAMQRKFNALDLSGFYK